MSENEVKWSEIKTLLEQGKTNRQISEVLNTAGFRYSGRRIDPSDVSRIAIENGFRRRKAPSFATVKPMSSLSQDVLDIMTSSLREPLKIKLVQLLTQGIEN